MTGNVYNLGNTEININKMQLCQAIKKHVPDFYITESPINEDPDKRNYIVSNENEYEDTEIKRYKKLKTKLKK
jgi:CRISPR/Cas system endoribonuclease Cas6 (RAMP superfamily)